MTGSIDLTDTEDFQVLTLRTGAEKQTVRLSLPAEVRPAVLVSDFEGTEVFFQNQEALDAMAGADDERPLQLGDRLEGVVDGLEDTFEPESSGVHRITVLSADGRATGYVVRVRRT